MERSMRLNNIVNKHSVHSTAHIQKIKYGILIVTNSVPANLNVINQNSE